jgi:hypothetical protein
MWVTEEGGMGAAIGGGLRKPAVGGRPLRAGGREVQECD